MLGSEQIDMIDRSGDARWRRNLPFQRLPETDGVEELAGNGIVTVRVAEPPTDSGGSMTIDNTKYTM